MKNILIIFGVPLCIGSLICSSIIFAVWFMEYCRTTFSHAVGAGVFVGTMAGYVSCIFLLMVYVSYIVCEDDDD